MSYQQLLEEIIRRHPKNFQLPTISITTIVLEMAI